jgi:hypothetical protein
MQNYKSKIYNFACSSPLKNDENISQIKKNINNLKIKNNPNRKGPLVSATFYNDGDIKMGINKNFWIIKNKKWIEINEKPIKIKINFAKLNKKQQKIIEKIPYIGLYNTNPIFIICVKTLKNSKKIYEIELILTELYKDNLNKKYKLF